MPIKRISLLTLSVCLTLAVMAGCGSDDDGPVYDTAANPYQLPPMALGLLDSLEHDRLLGLEDVTTAFGDLYSEHGELLDRGDWKEVIHRLGGMFKRKADSLGNLGLNSFTIAAEYYRLASFARPNNDELSYQAKSFGSWLDVYRDSSETIQQALLTMRSDLGSALSVARELLAGDSAAFQFYHEYLKEPLLTALSESGQLERAKIALLSRADQALALACEFVTEGPSKLARFSLPQIDLLAARIDSLDGYQYRLELYFMVGERIEDDLTVALNISAADTTRPEFSRSLQYTPIEIAPNIPATFWPRGQVMIVAHTVTGFADPTDIAVGLFANTGEAGRYLRIEGHNSNHFSLDLAEAGGGN